LKKEDKYQKCSVRKLFRQTLGFNPEFLSELGMTKLTNTKLKWIIRKYKKRMPIEEIAGAMNVSERRIQQIIKKYKLTNIMPILTKLRRPKTEISDEQRQAIDRAFDETKLSPRLLYYELRKRGIPVPKNKIYAYCKQKGRVIPDKNKQKKRKRCRYERTHSGSLVHGDTHRTSENHPYCLLWTDDASRKILAGIESTKPMNNKLAIQSFKQAEKEAWKYNVLIKQVNTDRGPEFFSNKKEQNKDSKSEFEIYLKKQGKEHIPSRIKNPQTNGKLERLWQEYNRHRWRFKTLKEWIDWYNNRLHGALNLEWAETPNEAFIRKRQPESILGEFWRLIDG
jgi:putative transposase